MTQARSETVRSAGAGPAASDLLLGFALGYAARGFAVLPTHWLTDDGGCSCGADHKQLKDIAKHPRTAHGLSDASCDPAVIARWWSRWPRANIGIATGPTSNLAVLDVDPPNGERTLAELSRASDDLTWMDTVISLTGRGEHYWFRYEGSPGSNAGKLGEGLDVRSARGYVLAPPSVNANGPYEFIGERRRFQPWPSWLQPPKREAVGATQSPRTYPRGPTPQTDRYARTALEREARTLLSTPEGRRNDQLNRSVHAVARLEQLSDAEVITAFTAIGLRIGLGSHETERTIGSALRARRP
jgi:hypothetical protein